MKSNEELIDVLLDLAFAEDISDGDHTTLSTIPADARGKSKLLIKEPGVLSGVDIAIRTLCRLKPDIKAEVFIRDGEECRNDCAWREGSLILFW